MDQYDNISVRARPVGLHTYSKTVFHHEIRTTEGVTMGLSPQALKFMGEIESVFEDITEAALPGEEAMSFRQELYQEYTDDGANRMKPWIKNRLISMKLWATDPPRWIEKIQPTWPFCDGRPMMYLDQFTVPNNAATCANAVPDVELLVFCARRPHPSGDGWTSYYQIIEQHSDL